MTHDQAEELQAAIVSFARDRLDTRVPENPKTEKTLDGITALAQGFQVECAHCLNDTCEKRDPKVSLESVLASERLYMGKRKLRKRNEEKKSLC